MRNILLRLLPVLLLEFRLPFLADVRPSAFRSKFARELRDILLN